MRILLCCLLFVSTINLAYAGKDPNKSYQIATQAYQNKDYEVALKLFLQLNEEKTDPNLLFNIAQCYRLLNQPEKAVEYYEQYLIKATTIQRREEIQKLIEDEKKKIPPKPKEEPLDKLGASPKVDPATSPALVPDKKPDDPEKPSLKPFILPGAFTLATATTGTIALRYAKQFKEEGFPEDPSKGRTPAKISAISCDVFLASTAVSSLWALRAYRKNAEALAR